MTQDWPRAFALAAQWRQAAVAVIDRVRAGEWSLDQAYIAADIDPAVGRVFAMKVYEAVPGIGKVKSRRAMAAVGLADDIFLADVAPDARDQIRARFDEILAEPN